MSEYFKYVCEVCHYSYVAVAFMKTTLRERKCEVCELDGREPSVMKVEELDERPW